MARACEIALLLGGAVAAGGTALLWLHHLSVVGEVGPLLRADGALAPLRALLAGTGGGAVLVAGALVLRGLRRRGARRGG